MINIKQFYKKKKKHNNNTCKLATPKRLNAWDGNGFLLVNSFIIETLQFREKCLSDLLNSILISINYNKKNRQYTVEHAPI